MGKNDKKKKGKAAKVAPDHAHLEHLKRVKKLSKIVADKNRPKKERKAAAAELESFKVATTERAKRRPEDVDRSVPADVDAYNENEGKESGNYLTSDAEKAARDKVLADSRISDAELKKTVEAKRAARAAETAKAAEAEPEKWAEARDAEAAPAGDVSDAPKKKRKAGKDEVVVEIDGEHLAVPAMEVVEVETEAGREFVGTPAEENKADRDSAGDVELFRDPVTGDEFDPEMNVPTNGQGRPLIWDPEAEKLVPMTRVTTFIDKLEDKTRLELWKLRNVLAGAAIVERDVASSSQEGEVAETRSIVAQALGLALAYEDEIKKTDKLDAKGKLFAGERAERLEKAKKIYDRGMDALADEAMEIAGVHLRAKHGTHLHELTAVFDAEGADALRARKDCTPADMADVMAYAAAIKKAGLEVIHVEKRVVNREHNTTGTLDRGFFYKKEGAKVRARVVGDLKTGRVDLSAGKIATQITEYALSEGYDPMTHEYEDLKLSKTVGLLIHLPAGTATCTIYELDLKKGVEGLKEIVAVGAWRSSTTEAKAYRGETPFYREIVKVEPNMTTEA